MTEHPSAPLDQPGRIHPSDHMSATRTTSAINALRAATTAAGSHAPVPAPDDVSAIGRLHEITQAAERRARRMLGTPGARRKLQQARAAEAAALEMHGFTSYEGFAAIYEPPRNADETASESEATIARIRELLTELGVDPLDDPLEAASAFLTTHEGELADTAAANAVAPQAVTPQVAAGGEASDADVAEHVVEHLDITSVMASFAPIVPPEAPEAAAPVASIPMDEPPVEIHDDGIHHDEIHLDEPAAAEVEIAVPAAELWAEPPPPRTAEDDEAVDRWIHAEARAERMHAEVDRAQAELMAMLARSADLEESVVTRDDELETAAAELERVRERVAELEGSIARSDAERDELERALSSSRDRVAELEAAVLERERASVQAAHDRTAALQAVVELEATLAQRTTELEAARAAVGEIEAALDATRSSVGEMEAELSTRATLLDQAEADLALARAANNELTVELETTRRGLDALDTHAEAIEAELADARRAVENPEARREAEALRQELAEAQQELVAARGRLRDLEAQHAATGDDLTRDRLELQQLQLALAAARDEMVAAREETLVARDETEAARSEAAAARDELLVARRAVDDTMAERDIAERAREAITIDTADLLARAEAQAASLLERANRDAEAIRQEALRWEEGLREEGRREQGRATGDDRFDAHHDPHSYRDETPSELVDRVERLERRVAKQRRRLDRIAETSNGGDPERDAEEIRRAARRDRELFRTELEGLLRRLAPLVDDTDDDFDA